MYLRISAGRRDDGLLGCQQQQQQQGNGPRPSHCLKPAAAPLLTVMHHIKPRVRESSTPPKTALAASQPASQPAPTVAAAGGCRHTACGKHSRGPTQSSKRACNYSIKNHTLRKMCREIRTHHAPPSL